MKTRGSIGMMVALALGIAACESDGGSSTDVLMGRDQTSSTDTSATDPGGTATDAAGICAKVFACFSDHWGWPSEEECRSNYMNDCKDTTGYLSCAAACVAGSCDNFETCEISCWSGKCE